jgi:hypothetical protein
MDRETAEEIKRHFEVAAEGLRSEMHELAGGLRTEIRVVDEKVDRSSVDLKSHFDVVGESLRSDIRTVAEGVRLDERATRSDRISDVRKIRRAPGDDPPLVRRARSTNSLVSGKPLAREMGTDPSSEGR